MATMFASELRGAYAARTVVLPGIGSGFGAAHRRYETAVWIVNPGRQRADVRVTFVPMEATTAAPREIVDVIEPNHTMVLDPLNLEAFGIREGSGALRITATSRVTAVARVWSRLPGDSESRAVGSTIEALPLEAAIGNGEQGVLPGIVADRSYRYKLHLVEVSGEALDLAMSIVDASGTTRSTRHVYVGGNQPRNIDLQSLIDALPSRDALLRIRGFHGNGRVVATLDQIAADGQDADVYAIIRASPSRARMPLAEVFAYVALALLVGAGAYSQKRVSQH